MTLTTPTDLRNVAKLALREHIALYAALTAMAALSIDTLLPGLR